mmetsp:Transcript_4680/g.11573  ORF Transcript_4680/g.11573 Transcript_4680/m.11573 type:complete len:398 (+) Transcript_4680:3985-5178(+)
MVLVWSHRNTGGARSRSTRVVGHLGVPGAPTTATTGAAVCPARSVSTMENVTHPFGSVNCRSLGTTTRGPAFQESPPPVIAPGGSVLPVMVTTGGWTGSEVLKVMVMVSGLLAVGSNKPLESTLTKVTVGGVTSTRTLAGSVESNPTTPDTVTDAVPVSYVMLHGTGSRSPHGRPTEATARQCVARPAASAVPLNTVQDTVFAVPDAGPMVAAEMDTAPDMSSASVRVSPSLPSPGYPGRSEYNTARSGTLMARTKSTGSASAAAGPVCTEEVTGLPAMSSAETCTAMGPSGVSGSHISTVADHVEPLPVIASGLTTTFPATVMVGSVVSSESSMSMRRRQHRAHSLGTTPVSDTDAILMKVGGVTSTTTARLRAPLVSAMLVGSPSMGSTMGYRFV